MNLKELTDQVISGKKSQKKRLCFYTDSLFWNYAGAPIRSANTFAPINLTFVPLLTLRVEAALRTVSFVHNRLIIIPVPLLIHCYPKKKF